LKIDRQLQYDRQQPHDAIETLSQETFAMATLAGEAGRLSEKRGAGMAGLPD
jgi:hypothetical protein